MHVVTAGQTHARWGCIGSLGPCVVDTLTRAACVSCRDLPLIALHASCTYSVHLQFEDEEEEEEGDVGEVMDTEDEDEEDVDAAGRTLQGTNADMQDGDEGGGSLC